MSGIAEAAAAALESCEKEPSRYPALCALAFMAGYLKSTDPQAAALFKQIVELDHKAHEAPP